MVAPALTAAAMASAIPDPGEWEDPREDPLAQLRWLYGEVRAMERGGRMRIITGVPMTPGATEDDAAQRFWADHGAIFRGVQPELTRRWAAKPKETQHTIIAYNQTLRGTPVEGALARIVVKTVGGMPRVVWASGYLSGEPTVGMEAPIIPAEVAAAVVQTLPGYGQLRVYAPPERVVLAGSGSRPDAWAWKVRAINGASPTAEPRSFFLNTATGEVLLVRDEWTYGMQDNTIQGVVLGQASPGMLPDIPANPPVSTALPKARVEWSEVGQGVWAHDYTDGSGIFGFGVGSHTSVDIRSILGPTVDEAGSHMFIVSYDGYEYCWPCRWPNHPPFPVSAAEHQDTISAPITVTLEFPDDTEYVVAQMNAQIHVNRARDYFLDRLEIDVDLLPHVLRIVVNACHHGGLACNAGYYPDTSFCVEGQRPTVMFSVAQEHWYWGSCRNPSYSSWIAHETGHYFLDVLVGHPAGTGQAGFGEGFSDVVHHLSNDDPVFGREFSPGLDVRPDPLVPNCQFPIQISNQAPCRCSPPHENGQVLSGIWQRLLIGFRDEYGHSAGLEKTRKLHVTWMLLTGANPDCSCNSAIPETLWEVLEADDDDGDLGNETPHWDIIIDAFDAHGISLTSECP